MDEGIETTRTTAAEGVRVRKTVETEPDETAVVTLAVAAERDEPTTVRVVEPALGSIPTDAIELTADDAGHWRLDDEPTFEREFDPGESHDVVYRVSGVDADRFDALDVDPVIAPAGAAVDELVDREDSDAVRELIAGDRDSLAAPAPAAGGVELAPGDDSGEPLDEHADEPADGPAAPVEVEADTGAEDAGEDAPEDTADVDLEEPSAASSSAAGDAPAAAADPDDPGVDEAPVDVDGSPGDTTAELAGDADEEDATVSGDSPEPADAEAAASGPTEMDAALAATPSGGVARALLQELREGNVDDETREALREELEPARSQAVRIRHLQSEVAEFSAYVEMLDGFVDEHGSFESLLERISSLEGELEAVRSELDGLADAVEDVDEVSAELEALRADESDLESRLDRLAAELETVDDRLEEFGDFKEQLSGAFQGDDGRGA